MEKMAEHAQPPAGDRRPTQEMVAQAFARVRSEPYRSILDELLRQEGEMLTVSQLQERVGSDFTQAQLSNALRWLNGWGLVGYVQKGEELDVDDVQLAAIEASLAQDQDPSEGLREAVDLEAEDESGPGPDVVVTYWYLTEAGGIVAAAA